MDLTELRGKYIDAVARAADEAALEEVRIAALGKKGEVSALMATLGKMEPEARKAAGAAMNVVKDEIDAALRARKVALADAALDARLKSEWLDVTLPSRPRRMGSIHPVSQVMDELTAIFADMGFSVA
jgi:phenylalanyl-tRNA synthetase alpha chain